MKWPAVRQMAALAVWLAVAAYGPVQGTLHLPFYSDDVDHMHRVAEYHSGERPLGSLLFVPHNEQTLPVLRLLFLGSIRRIGFDPAPLRVSLLALHVAGAIAAGLLCYFWTQSAVAMWLAGTAYAASAGFFGTMIWAPANGIFLLGAVFLWWSLLLAVAPVPSPRLAAAGCLLLLALSGAGMNGAVLGAGSIAMFLWLERRDVRRMVLCGLVALAILLAARFNPLALGAPHVRIQWETLGALVWLIAAAPARFLLCWYEYPRHYVPVLPWVAAGVWMCIVATLWWLDARQRRILFILTLGPALVAAGVALGRPDPLSTLYDTDRYHYFFLLPLAVYAGILSHKLAGKLSRIPRAIPGGLLVVLMAAGCAGTRIRYRNKIPWEAMHGAAEEIGQGEQLLNLIRKESATGRDLTLADGYIPFRWIHKGRMTLRALLYTEYPGGLPGVRFSGQPLGTADSALQNRILNQWAIAMQRPGPPVCVMHGILERLPADSWIDFRESSYEDAIVSGLWDWEGSFRWTGAEAVVRLRAEPSAEWKLVVSAPVAELRRVRPGWTGMGVALKMEGQPVGAIRIDQPGLREFRLRMPPSLPPGLARLSLQPDTTWIARELFPGNPDERRLGVALHAIGLAGQPVSLRCPD